MLFPGYMIRIVQTVLPRDQCCIGGQLINIYTHVYVTSVNLFEL